MDLRRSNRRMTITGSSMFVASTPLVPPAIIENTNFDDGNASPQWICAEEAFGNMKTPKIGKMTRRTTLTRQNIFNDETIIGGAITDGEVLKPPRFFIPLSPPGVKTRSRRSSMHMGPPQPAEAKQVANAAGRNTVNSNTAKNDTKATGKVASKRTVSEVIPSVKDQKPPAPTKVSSRKSMSKGAADGGDTRFTNIQRLSPIVDVDIKVDMKKPRRSIRQQYIEEEETMETNESIAFAQEFQTPMTQIYNENGKFKSLITDTPKVPASSTATEKSLSRSSRTAIKTPKSKSDSKDTLSVDNSEMTTTTQVSSSVSQISSAPQPVGLKRQMSKEENEEIEMVVKKMFTPSKFYSSKELSHKQKYKSPNSGKASSSPARSTIMKDTMNTGRKSPARKAKETSIAPKTPSRAAPKARKILGVSTNSTPFNNNTQNRTNKSVEDMERLSSEETVFASSESEDVSFREENENNMTLSHSSHSQWCSIL